MSKFLGALILTLSLSLFGASAVSAFEPSPAAAALQDGDKGKKKHHKKKHKKGKKKGSKKGGKKGNKGKKGKKKNDQK